MISGKSEELAAGARPSAASVCNRVGKINTGSIGWWSGGWKGVVRSQVVFQTMVRKIGVESFLRKSWRVGIEFPGQNIANTNIYYYCHVNNKPFRYGYHNVILDPSPLTVRSRSGCRVFVVKSEALYYPRWGRGMLSTVTPPLMNKP
jgi:hypothetical protein